MPELVEDLKRLVRIPSVASDGFPAEPLVEAHDLVTGLLRGAGVDRLESVRIEGKQAPVVVGQVAGPPGSPTVLLYSHYDVVPAGETDLWDTPPFEPVERDGAVYGRGVADSKANIMAIVGALKVLDGRPPVGIKVIVEGQEEVGSPFDVYPLTAPDLFRADAMIIADVGSVRPGVPTLTTALRGSAQVEVAVRTLAGDKHSGNFGGAAPDARTALIHVLASLHDADGDLAVPGLRRAEWTGGSYSEAEFRELAEVADGVPLMGTGNLGGRLWSGPALTVIGFDAPPTTAPLNAVAGSAKATLNLRVHPEQDAAQAQQALVHQLRAQRPFGIGVEVTPGEVGNGFAASLGGPGYESAMHALEYAWGAAPQHAAMGGSIPLVMALHQAVPAAEKLLFGATDSYANIHAPNERVPLMAAMGYDRMAAAATIILGAMVGAMASTVNPFSIGVASGEAGVSIGDGIVLRVVLWVVLTGLAIGYVVRYAERSRRDRSRSIVGFDPAPVAAAHVPAPAGEARLSVTQRWVLGITIVTFALMIFSVIPWSSIFGATTGPAEYDSTHEVAQVEPYWFELNWWFPQLAMLFFLAAIITGVVARMGEKRLVSLFQQGMADMIGPAIVVVLARGVAVIMNNTQTLDTVLHAMEQAVGGASAGLFTVLVSIVNAPLAFVIPSSSGHATLAMPLLAPLSEFAGVSPALTITAYQMGHGFMMLFSPTNVVVVGGLAIAKVGYDKYLRFTAPLLGVMLVVSCVVLFAAASLE